MLLRKPFCWMVKAHSQRLNSIALRGRERPMSRDDDLEVMSRDQLVAEIRKLRDGIRRHRDASGHELCWHHPDLWGLLPERTDPVPEVPDWPQFLRGCVRYRESLDRQLPHAVRSSKEMPPR